MNLLNVVIPVALPAITFFLITLVGMDTTTDDFRKVLRTPKPLLVGTLGQYILPFLALLILRPMHLKPEIAAGMVVIACAPAGGISNVYTYLARANTALSVALTCLSCAAAGVMMPLLMRLSASIGGDSVDIQLPLKALLTHAILLLVVPVTLGLWIRHRWEAAVQRHGSKLRLFGFLSLFCLIAFIILQSRETFVHSFSELVVAASVFIVLSMLGAVLLSRAAKLQPQDGFALVSELGVRNVAISTTVVVTVLSRPEFAVFGTAYFLIEIPLLLGAVALYRSLGSGRSSAIATG